jgi:Na+/melibiose symporter-like transporter
MKQQSRFSIAQLKNKGLKLIPVIAFIAIAVLFFSAACNKTNTNSTYYMEANLGPNNLKGTYCMGYIQGGALIIQGGNFSGTTLQFPYISFNIANFNNTVGTFFIDGVVNHASLDSSASLSLVATTGTVDIVSTGASAVTGTFSFTCNNGTQVTNGTFNAQMQ